LSIAAIWGPEDETITYSVAGLGLMRQRTDTSGEPEKLVEHKDWVFPRQWLDVGRALLYNPVYSHRVAEIYTLEVGAYSGPS
jgi:hypothetical protein